MKIIVDHFRELYRYRVLVASLVARDVKARYRGSLLGYFWTLLNPLLMLAVYRLVFSKYTRAVDMPNYALFLLTGIFPWLWLATSIGTGTTSISAGGALITRVCMPPQVLPAVAVLSNLANFIFSLPVAIGAGIAYGVWPAPALLALPVVMAIELVFLYGIVLALAAVTVRFRDVAFLVQNLLQLWFFLTPIAYVASQVPEKYRWLSAANPATSIIVPFQSILYARAFPEPAQVLMGAGWALVLLPLAVRVFESARDTFAEEI